MIIRKEIITPEMRERFQAFERTSSRRGRDCLKEVPVANILEPANSGTNLAVEGTTRGINIDEKTMVPVNGVSLEPNGDSVKDWTGARERVLAMHDQKGHVSTVVLATNGESVLVKEISSQYPGGWLQFAGDLHALHPDLSISKKRFLAWTKPGFNDEQNLQLGINNIQLLFFERFPRFREKFEFDEEGKVKEDQRSAARAFVMENFVSHRKFTSVMGNRFLNKNTAPYFKGSHFRAVKESFEPLGIKFDDIELKDISISGRGRWIFLRENPEIRDRIIEREIERCVAEGVKLTKKGLRDAGKAAFEGIIRTYYPGGLKALRDKFTEARIKERTPKGLWKSPKGQGLIREEAKAFIAEHGQITQSLLRKYEKSYLENAANKNYPGGWQQVLEDIGYASGRKKYVAKGFWKTPEGLEEMRNRGEAFMHEHNSITKRLLMENDQSDLYAAVLNNYPGRWRQFLKDINSSEPTNVPHGFWVTAEGQDLIREEGRALLAQHEKVTQKLLKEVGNYYLYSAVLKFYPGGWKLFLKDIGAPETKTFSRKKEAPIELNDLSELPQEARNEILDSFSEFISSQSDTNISLLEYAVKYMKGRS